MARSVACPKTETESLRLTVLPAGIEVSARPAETVRQALERAGFEVLQPCGGDGLCGKCRVIAEGPNLPPPTAHRHLSEDQARQGWRLACQLPVTGNLTVRLTDDWRRVTPAGSARSRPISDEPVQPQGGLRRTESESTDAAVAAKGLAVDLGTTTLVATLVSLGTGDELATVSTPNPQVRFGQDVMSRIQRGSSPEGLAELNGVIAGALDSVVSELCRVARSDRQEITDVVLGGNPTMLQLAAGMDPNPLGQAPFVVDIQGGRDFAAQTFGLSLSPRARAYIPPITHAFVGSDISAGLLVAQGFFDGSDPVLFVDIGTNGEMVLRSRQTFLSASTAAGPAFEGGGLRCGMPAISGAVANVRLRGGDVVLGCVDEARPRGLCGSGVIDLVAVLLETGVVDATGRMVRPGAASDLSPSLQARLDEVSGQPAFRLAEDVVFTQEDVRQVQLAKGAVRTGIDLLLAETDVPPARLVLAGGFGTHLDRRSLAVIGMVPPELAQNAVLAGNTSRSGCVRLLQAPALRHELETRMQQVGYLSLIDCTDYMDRFVANMEFACPS